MDFLNDVLSNQRKFRTLNVIDDFNREAIAIEAAHSMPAVRVTRILQQVICEQGKPKCIRVDNDLNLSVRNSVPGARIITLKFDIHSPEGQCKMDI